MGGQFSADARRGRKPIAVALPLPRDLEPHHRRRSGIKNQSPSGNKQIAKTLQKHHI